MSLAKVLALVTEFRCENTHTPIVLMGYCNPIEAMGLQRFADAAAQAGVDGVLVVDCPPEEAQDYAAALRRHRIDLIYLLAPTSTPARYRLVGEIASGYVYYVSLKGVTGAVISIPMRWRGRCRPSARPSACRWAWVSASRMPPRPRVWRPLPMRW